MIEKDLDHGEDVEDRKEDNETLGGDNMSDDVLRREIGGIAEASWGQRLIKRESHDFYKGLVLGKESEKLSSKDLRDIYKHAKEQQDKAGTILKYLNDAIKSGVASENDRDFLLSKIIHEPEFVSKFIQAETLIKDKIKRMEEDRSKYDVIVNSPLAKGKDFLQVDEYTKVKVPGEKEFLKMKVPERRKFLKKIEEDFKKAEKYAEKEGDIESQKMTKEYQGLLEKAKKEGIIGKETVKKYMEDFKKVNLNEKKYWMRELKSENQLKRYEDLWKDIRKTFKGSSLKKIEGLREKMGYTELFREFGSMKEKEGQNIEVRYEKKIAELLKKKIISKHTYVAFLQDIKSQSFDGKQRYLESFPMQMRRYEILRAKIDQIKNKGAKKTLDKMYDSLDNGFSQIESTYNRLSGSAEGNVSSVAKSDADKELDTIENKEIKAAVKASMDKLDRTQKLTFTQKISNFFEGKTTQKEDPMTYQKNLYQAREKQRKLNFNEMRVCYMHESSEQEGQEAERLLDTNGDGESIKYSPVNDNEAQEGVEDLNPIQRTEGDLSFTEAPENHKKRNSLRIIKVGKGKLQRGPFGAGKSKVSKKAYDNKVPYHATKVVNADKTFEKNTYLNDKKEKQSVMRVEVNSIESIKSLNSEQSLNNKNTRVNNMVWLNGRYIELGLGDTRAMIRYNRKCLAKTTESEQERVAA